MENKVISIAEVPRVNLNVASYEQPIIGFTPGPVDHVVKIIGAVGGGIFGEALGHRALDYTIW